MTQADLSHRWAHSHFVGLAQLQGDKKVKFFGEVILAPRSEQTKFIRLGMSESLNC